VKSCDDIPEIEEGSAIMGPDILALGLEACFSSCFWHDMRGRVNKAAIMNMKYFFMGRLLGFSS
jgi:hypothetical protein